MRNLTANPTTTSLLAAAAVLAVALGLAGLRSPADPLPTGPAGTTRTSVERTSAVCPQPLQGMTGSTVYTALTPARDTGVGSGSARLFDIAGGTRGIPGGSSGSSGSASASPSAKASASPSGKASAAPSGSASGRGASGAARASLLKIGVPVTAKAGGGENAPAVAALADGGYAPGFTVQQTTTVGGYITGRGLSGLTCGAAGTDFWFVGAGTAEGRADYVVLSNAEDQAAVVDILLHGPDGEIVAGTGSGITVPPGSSLAVLLSTLTSSPVSDLAVHAVARTGRVGAALRAADGTKGSDWLPASAAANSTVVIPGLPADLASARLVVFAPGDGDADLKVQLSGPNGWFTPAGHETVHVKAGMVTAEDLGAVTRGQASALRLTPTDSTQDAPVLAGLRIDRGKGTSTDAAWLAGTARVGERATVADNRAGASTLYLTSTGAAATVRVTSSASTSGGSPTSKEVRVPAGATVALAPPVPSGAKGAFAVTVETVSGGPVAAARMLALPHDGVPMFTVQSLVDDHSAVLVPHAAPNPAILTEG